MQGADLITEYVPRVLCTVVEHRIPVVWVIWNDLAWASPP